LPFFADARFESTSRSTVDASARTLWLMRCGLIVATLVLYWWSAGERGLWSSHEGRVAQSSQNSLESGDWLLPKLHTGVVETQKPPMYYWLATAAAWAHGDVDGWSVRFPSFLAATIAVLIVFEFGRGIGGMSVGLMAATILGCTTRFAWLARVGRVDMPLTAAVLTCLFLFWRSRVQFVGDQRSTRLPYAFYAVLAVAVLLKGPIALALVGMPIFLWMTLSGRPLLPGLQAGAVREWRELRVVSGSAAMLLGVGSWFSYADLDTNGAFTREFFVYHNLGRLVGIDETLHPSPWWTYLPRIAVDFFPWSLLLPAVGVYYWKAWRSKRRSKALPTVLFLTAWFVGTFVLLSAASFKRMDYLLPLYPAAALLLAVWLDERRRRFFDRRQTTIARDYLGRSRWIVASAFLLAAIAAPLIFWGERQFTRKGGLAKTVLTSSVLDRHLNETDDFMLMRVESILREHWPLLGILLPGLVASVWLLHTGWHDRQSGRFTAGLALPWTLCFLLQVQVVLPRLDALQDMARFAQTIRHLAGEGRTIYYFDEFDADLVFHAGKPAKVVERWEELADLARTPEPVFVVLRSDDWKRRVAEAGASTWCEIANNCQFAKHREPRSFLTNRPDEVADRLHLDPQAFIR
jgi:4-amino-4-deoxy-L-arabinose transferase-like glycosyltransferase